MDNKNHVENRSKIRRRGLDLEIAIPQAAWDELQNIGYSFLTMEGVVARAKTSKSAVYRRWSNRGEPFHQDKYMIRSTRKVNFWLAHEQLMVYRLFCSKKRHVWY